MVIQSVAEYTHVRPGLRWADDWEQLGAQGQAPRLRASSSGLRASGATYACVAQHAAHSAPACRSGHVTRA